jgi:hypothetical protein
MSWWWPWCRRKAEPVNATPCVADPEAVAAREAASRARRDAEKQWPAVRAVASRGDAIATELGLIFRGEKRA